MLSNTSGGFFVRAEDPAAEEGTVAVEINFHSACRKLSTRALGKTLDKLKEEDWWPSIRKYMKGYIGSCIECLYNKVTGGKQPGKLHSTDKIGILFHLDYLGPFVSSTRANTYLLLTVDGFNKITILKAVKNTTSSVTAKALEEIINFMGAVFRVIADRGTAFTRFAFKKLCNEKNSIKSLMPLRRQEQMDKEYQPSDLIRKRKEAPATGESRKLREKYKGPYVVVEKLPHDRYRIEDMPEIQRNQRFYREVVAVDAIKSYLAQNSNGSDSMSDECSQDGESDDFDKI
ncbi:hypothetical protein Trydic_g11827 [Trypoxylus dichotomus]